MPPDRMGRCKFAWIVVKDYVTWRCPRIWPHERLGVDRTVKAPCRNDMAKQPTSAACVLHGGMQGDEFERPTVPPDCCLHGSHPQQHRFCQEQPTGTQ